MQFLPPSDEQWQEVDDNIEWWKIQLTTQNDQETIDSVKEVYDVVHHGQGNRKTDVVLLDSPYQVNQAYFALRERTPAVVTQALQQYLGYRRWAEIKYRGFNFDFRRVTDWQTYARTEEVKDCLGYKYLTELEQRINEVRGLSTNIGKAVSDQLKEDCSSCPRTSVIGGIERVYWFQTAMGVYLDCLSVFRKKRKRYTSTYIRWLANVGYILLNTTPLVSRKPTKVSMKQGVLHCETAPAIEFADGWGVWSIDGIKVDRQIVLRPETQTIEQLEKERNRAVRELRIERFGWRRYLEEINAHCLHRRKKDGKVEKLFQLPQGKKRFVVVDPANPNAKPEVVEVPKDIQNCGQAKNWFVREISIQVPDNVDTTFGWRCWTWDGRTLISPSQRTPWESEILEAEDYSDESAVRGVGGIHARLVPRDWKRAFWPNNETRPGKHEMCITGIVERFGRAVLGKMGWRAEQAVIRELLAPDEATLVELQMAYPAAKVYLSGDDSH